MLEEKYELLKEGINDVGIFKAVFMAGGPGSGKSFVSSKLGLKALGLRPVNSDDFFETGLKKAGLSLKMPEDEEESREAVRIHAKALTAKRQDLYVKGRLGLIIDSTARDVKKIMTQNKLLKQLGYETSMVFVNTTLETALERNANRTRSIPEKIVKSNHAEVRKNLGKLQGHFGRSSFIIIDNDGDEKDLEKATRKIYPRLKKFTSTLPDNKMVKAWVNAFTMKPAKNLELPADHADHPVRQDLAAGDQPVREKLKTFREQQELSEVTDKEINAMKKLSKDMEKVKKGWQTIAKMGDKTLKSTTFNREYKSILDAQQGVLKTIGTLTNLKIMQSTKREELQEKQTYKSIIQGLEKDKKEVAKKSKSFGQNDTKYIDKAIKFLKMLEKEGIPAGQISQVDFVTNRVPKFFVGNPQKSPSFSKFTPNDVKKAVAHAKRIGIMNEDVEELEEAMKLAQIVRKHKSALMKAKRSGNLELPSKVEDDLMNWAMNSGEIRTDDPDEFDDWLDNNIDDLVPRLKIREATFDSLSSAQKTQLYKLYSKGMDLPAGSPAFKKNKSEIDKLRKKLKLDEGENVDRVKDKHSRERDQLKQRHANELDTAKEKDFKDAQDQKKRERVRDEESDEVLATKEKIYKDLKKKRKYFEKEYGKEKADDIMHGTAMNMAKKQHKVSEGKFKTELSKQFALEALSMQQRRAIAMRMRRQAQKIARKRARNKKRMKSQDQLLKKAQKMARDTLAKKMTGGKSLSTLSIGARIAVAKKLDKKKSAITRLAKKMLPKVKKGEVERLKKFRAQQSEK